MGEGAMEDKTTLAQKDVRFARTIQRLQRTVIHELEKVGIIHLYTLYISKQKSVPLSRIAELYPPLAYESNCNCIENRL